MRKLADRLPLAPVDLLVDGGAVDEQVEGLAHGGIGQQRVRGPGARALALDLGPGIGEVAHRVLDVARRPDIDAALAALLEPQEDVVLHLQVPGVVDLAGLEHGTRRRGRVAAALHLERVEERPVGNVVARVELGAHDVAGPEVDDAVGARPDGLEVGGRLAGVGALVRLEHVLGQDHAAVAAEGVGPEGLGPREGDLDGVAVGLVDAGTPRGRSPTVTAAVAGSETYSHVKTTSSAVKGLPSCQTTFFFSRQITHVPSLARPPLATDGTSAARAGVRLPSGS